ncbi:exosortase-associated protein EpsI, B-type [Aquabacterium sp. A3]|uniref:exosortase-associated protein EpsI, B-type n=1 Tax=Aquabacterium sp. A3 TaxID=3132829 RepID=UPI0031196782
MTSIVKLKTLAVLLVLAASYVAADQLKPAHRMEESIVEIGNNIPEQFGDWRADHSNEVIEPSPDVQETVDKIYDQIVNRTYVNSKGDRVMLSIAYGGDQTDALKAHRQEVCYTAQGFKVSKVHNDRLHVGAAALPVTRMFAEQGSRKEPVTYWFTMADRAVLGRFERLFVQIGYGLKGVIPDGALVRVSSFGSDPKAAYVLHDAFVRELVGHINSPRVIAVLGTNPGA